MKRFAQLVKGLATAACAIALISMLLCAMPYAYRQSVLGWLWLIACAVSRLFYRLNVSRRRLTGSLGSVPTVHRLHALAQTAHA